MTPQGTPAVTDLIIFMFADEPECSNVMKSVSCIATIV
jgi:hypothetical protein